MKGEKKKSVGKTIGITLLIILGAFLVGVVLPGAIALGLQEWRSSEKSEQWGNAIWEDAKAYFTENADMLTELSEYLLENYDVTDEQNTVYFEAEELKAMGFDEAAEAAQYRFGVSLYGRDGGKVVSFTKIERLEGYIYSSVIMYTDDPEKWFDSLEYEQITGNFYGVGSISRDNVV